MYDISICLIVASADKDSESGRSFWKQVERNADSLNNGSKSITSHSYDI